MTAHAQQDLKELLSLCGAPASTGEDGGPVFAEPWQAEAVATTLALSRRGIFTWAEWVGCFSAHIADEPQAKGEDANSAYYRQWLSALEDMLTRKQMVEREQVAQTKEDWRRSYLHTEHGKPVDFQRGLSNRHVHGDDDHHHHPTTETAKPISISPASRR